MKIRQSSKPSISSQPHSLTSRYQLIKQLFIIQNKLYIRAYDMNLAKTFGIGSQNNTDGCQDSQNYSKDNNNDNNNNVKNNTFGYGGLESQCQVTLVLMAYDQSIQQGLHKVTNLSHSQNHPQVQSQSQSAHQNSKKQSTVTKISQNSTFSTKLLIPQSIQIQTVHRAKTFIIQFAQKPINLHYLLRKYNSNSNNISNSTTSYSKNQNSTINNSNNNNNNSSRWNNNINSGFVFSSQQIIQAAISGICSLADLHNLGYLHNKITTKTCYFYNTQSNKILKHHQNNNNNSKGNNLIRNKSIRRQSTKSQIITYFGVNILDIEKLSVKNPPNYDKIQQLMYEPIVKILGLKPTQKDDLQSLIYILIKMATGQSIFSIQRYFKQWKNQTLIRKWKIQHFYREMVNKLPSNLYVLAEIYLLLQQTCYLDKPDYSQILKKLYKQKQNQIIAKEQQKLSNQQKKSMTSFSQTNSNAHLHSHYYQKQSSIKNNVNNIYTNTNNNGNVGLNINLNMESQRILVKVDQDQSDDSIAEKTDTDLDSHKQLQNNNRNNRDKGINDDNNSDNGIFQQDDTQMKLRNSKNSNNSKFMKGKLYI